MGKERGLSKKQHHSRLKKNLKMQTLHQSTRDKKEVEGNRDNGESTLLQEEFDGDNDDDDASMSESRQSRQSRRSRRSRRVSRFTQIPLISPLMHFLGTGHLMSTFHSVFVMTSVSALFFSLRDNLISPIVEYLVPEQLENYFRINVTKQPKIVELINDMTGKMDQFETGPYIINFGKIFKEFLNFLLTLILSFCIYQLMAWFSETFLVTLVRRA
jgi:hypothetical protein